MSMTADCLSARLSYDPSSLGNLSTVRWEDRAEREVWCWSTLGDEKEMKMEDGQGMDSNRHDLESIRQTSP